jgi:glycosyltransferase involved in cell wall biosynthesis
MALFKGDVAGESAVIPSVVPDNQDVAVRPLRILVVATEAPPVRGGIARIVGYLRDGLQRRGHHVDVLAYPQVRRVTFGEIRLSSLIFNLPGLFSRVNTYDIVHIHGTTPTLSDVFLLFVRLRNPHLRVVYTHHVDLDLKAAAFLNGLYNRVHHRLSARADAVVAATRDTLDLLGTTRNSHVIPYGIDLTRFAERGEKDTRFTVLFIGQFRPWKGVRVLLHAMSRVTGAHLILAGHGPEEHLYRALASELGLSVEFHIGEEDEQVVKLYQRAHVVVVASTSRLEAFGLALVEGMAAGCIPLASDLPGVREVVGARGFLFPPGDADALATILARLCDDPHMVQRMGERARAYAESFDQERTIAMYEKVFASLVAPEGEEEQTR